MGFIRWLKGLAIMVASAIFFVFTLPLLCLLLAFEDSSFAIVFDGMAFGSFILGLIFMLWGWYIMKEERPQGRFRVE